MLNSSSSSIVFHSSSTSSSALEQLRRQTEGCAVAGAFDPAEVHGAWRVQIVQKLETSKIAYIEGGVVVKGEFFATREGHRCSSTT